MLQNLKASGGFLNSNFLWFPGMQHKEYEGNWAIPKTVVQMSGKWLKMGGQLSATSNMFGFLPAGVDKKTGNSIFKIALMARGGKVNKFVCLSDDNQWIQATCNEKNATKFLMEII